MTTITIERSFLIRVLEQLDVAQSLLERSRHHAKTLAVYEELRAALATPATAPEPTTDEAVSRLSKALRDDLDYAWGWHCNVAMTAFDAGCPHDVANEGAARFMQLLAGVDTRKHPGFAGTQTNPMGSTDDRHAQELLAQEITLQNMRERHAQELCAYQITVDKLRAERNPMSQQQIDAVWPSPEGTNSIHALVRAVEAFHGIKETP
jgi:hypothetical protein